MFLFRSVTPLSLSSLFPSLCLTPLGQPVNGASNPTTLAAVSNSTTLDNALGINCRGSAFCPSQDLAADYIGIMLSIVNGRATCRSSSKFNCGPLNDTDVYEPNALIVCLPQGKSFLGGICAFTQGRVNPLGIFGVHIKRKLKQLSDHGCQFCGSVPLGDGNDPDVAGILTVNYISGVACPGLCPPTHYYADGLVGTL